MLVLGDLACPSSHHSKMLVSSMEKSGLFTDKLLLCNLEGMIRDDEPYSDEKLFNHSDVLGAFDPARTIFSIANNHTYDYPELINETKNLLKQKGFAVNGTINNGKIEPTIVKEGAITYAVFTHCWRVYTQTNPNRLNSIRIVDCAYEEFYETVKQYVVNNVDKRIICFFHWNYDMEKLPFPAYRKLSHDLIDAGVYAVIGNHSHVPQGAEFYKGRIIVYGLGNFYIPSGKFFDGKLIYPDESKKMMVVELQSETNKVLFHWFWTDKDEAIAWEKTEDEKNCSELVSYSPYASMDDRQYLSYFKSNRVKRTLVPVFDNYKGRTYGCREWVAITRIKVIKLIKK